jgi:phytoene dehydrogenase-like protein
MRKKVSIIGAGIAGLSAGCYLQMNGYDTQIFETHDKPGGLCTAWERKGYTIDGCIHWLVGSGPNDTFYNLWNELLDMEEIEFVDHEEYIRVEDKRGNFISVYTDVDRLEAEMLDKAPEDKELVLEFINAVKKFSGFNLPIEKAPETYSPLDAVKSLIKFLPYSKAFRKWGGITLREYAEQFTNPLLKKTFLSMFWPEIAAVFIVMSLVWMNRKSAGYPVGGSLKFSSLIGEQYLKLGGKINYRSKVSRVITENNSAKGIILDNGAAYSSDMVISAADGYSTIFKILEGRYTDENVRNYYEHYETFPSYVQASFGISRKFEKEAHFSAFPLIKPLTIDDSVSYESITVRIFNFDPTLSPEGKTLMTVILPTHNYKYWENLRTHDIERYRKEKERIADEVIEALENRYGDIRANLDMIDVSTPSTVIRYTNNWKGSLEGWVLSPKIGFKSMKKTLPGLTDFYMAGQWVEPGGGLPTAMMSGRNVSQIICKEDKKLPFKTSLAQKILEQDRSTIVHL